MACGHNIIINLYGTYSCVRMCVLISINPHVPQKNISITTALPNRVVGDELGVYESNKQQVRENEIDMLTI